MRVSVFNSGVLSGRARSPHRAARWAGMARPTITFLILGLSLEGMTAVAQNFTVTPPSLSIERQVEGLGLRVIGDAGVYYEPRVGTEPGQWTNLSGHISNGTNELHWIDRQGTTFFQWVADDRMRFPDWQDFVEWKLTFNFLASC